MHVVPVVTEVLGDQATMALLCRVFTAQEHGARAKLLRVDPVFDLPKDHQVDEPLLVLRPTHLFVLIRLEQLLCRCQQWLVAIGRSAQLSEEPFKVVAFGKASELRNVVDPDVNQPINAGDSELSEELASAVLRETDRTDLHGCSPSPNSLACVGVSVICASSTRLPFGRT